MGEKLDKGKIYIDGVEFGEITELEFNPEKVKLDEGRFSFNHSMSGTITVDKRTSKHLLKMIRKAMWKYRIEKLISKFKGVFK